MPFNPINYGNIATQGENILAARQRRDPNSMQNQLLAAKLRNAQNPTSIASFSKTPTLVRGPDGTIKAFQLSDQGGAQEVDFGPGGAPAIKGTWRDVGNGFKILDPYLGGSQGQQPASQPQETAPAVEPKGIPPQDTPEHKASVEKAVQVEQTAGASDRKKQEILGSSAAKKAEAGFAAVDKIKTNIFNLTDALAAIDSGAETGPIQQYLPTVRSASIELQNVRSRLGLDVVGAVTFGALSKGELDLALNTALPTSKQPEALRVWINNKIKAQSKLMGYLEEQSIFLSQPSNTQAMWAELVKQKKSDPRINRPAGNDNVDITTMTDAELDAYEKKLRGE